MSKGALDETMLARARSGDGDAFRQLTNPYRPELHMHCYRILGSLQDAEDALQETLLAAWQALDRFDGRLLRAWLYRIATNRCLNELRDSERRQRGGAPTEASGRHDSDEPWWLEPYPDILIDETDPGPEARYETRESIALSFIAALQHLPTRQRAVLILRDVLGFTAAETADILGTTPVSVNSALQRARRDFHAPPDRDRVPLPRSAEEAAVVDRFVNALDQGDVDQLIAVLRDDSRLTMPPEPDEYRGAKAISDFFQGLGFWGSPLRLVPTRANGQPALGYYVRRQASTRFHVQGLLVFEVGADCIARITRFGDTAILSRFGLPRVLPPSS